MLQKPFFSVIIPLFNKRDSIEETLRSVLNQDFKNFEIIIVDDGSTDNSAFIVNNIADQRIHLFRQKNRGPAAARNQGVKLSTATWIIFLDADDKFLPNALSTFSSLINQFPKYTLFVCNFYSRYKGNNKPFSYNFCHGPVTHPYRLWALNRFYMRTGNYAIKKDLILEYPFSETLHRYEDSECFFKIMDNVKIFSSSIPVMIYDLSYCKASHICDHIEDDYLGHLNFKKVSFWKYLVLLDLSTQAISLYPEGRRMYHHEYYNFINQCLLKILHIYYLYLRIKRKLKMKLNKINCKCKNSNMCLI
ncbi:MAG: glycosyltransferase [Clostridium tyrobutyricum]|jgi:glycosyltransferase involved in cell wall biosynthesis|nr:glycosyltransferase [Clostridium tyrobutyricum]